MTVSHTVLIRADGGPRIGRGHVVRQISLARALRDRGAEVMFVSASRPDPLIEAAGMSCTVIPSGPPPYERPWPLERQHADAEATIAAAGGAVDTVIVDHFGLERAWDSRVRSIAGSIVAVSDLATAARDVDRLVDHNWYGPESAHRYDGLLPQNCATHIGPRYALLQRDYRDLRVAREPLRWPPQRILVSYGGTDPGGETPRLLEALLAAECGAFIDVVAGSRAAVSQELGDLVATAADVELHVEMPTLAPLLARADLSFGASGAATWERMCFGVPGVVTTTAPDQSGVTRALHEAGFTTWAGLAGQVSRDDYLQIIATLMKHGPRRPPELVDGWGADRVAALINPAAQPKWELRAAGPHDAPVHLTPSHIPDHWRRDAEAFWADLDDPAVHRLTLSLDGVPMGWVRGSRRRGGVRVVGAVDPAVSSGDVGLYGMASAGRWRIAEGSLVFEPAGDDRLDFEAVGSSVVDSDHGGELLLPLED